MSEDKTLFIPVILGTTRKGRMSANVANFVLGEVSKRQGIESQLIDILKLDFTMKDAGEDIKDAKFSAAMNQADGLIIIAPEYNHGYPGWLKHVLDTNLQEYIHKPVGICGVSAGPFGGTRVVQNMLPVMRELGLITIFWDGNFSQVQNIFDENGKLREEAYIRRLGKFLDELVWMARVLRYGRLNVTLN